MFLWIVVELTPNLSVKVCHFVAGGWWCEEETGGVGREYASTTVEDVSKWADLNVPM